MSFASDLDFIMADAAKIGGPCVITIGGRDIVCDAGGPDESLAPDILGDPHEQSGSVWVKAGSLPSGTAVGSLASWRGKSWRISGMEESLDGVEVKLSLSGVRS